MDLIKSLLKMNEIFSFGVRLKGRDTYQETVINAKSASKAKYEFFLNISDCFSNLKFTDIRARKIGRPQSSRDFLRNAEYRGLPEIRCGCRVSVGENKGTVVGHNASANFDVCFDNDSKYKGATLSVHPSELKVLALDIQ